MSDTEKIFHDDPADDPAPIPVVDEDKGVVGMIERAFDSLAQGVAGHDHPEGERRTNDDA
jgi:hypothetical protein